MAHEHAPLRRPPVVERRPAVAAMLHLSAAGGSTSPGHATAGRSVNSPSARSTMATSVSVSAPVSVQCARISHPGDPAEIEAKQTARKVVQMAEPASPPRVRPDEEGKKKKDLVQRAEAPGRTAAPAAPIAATGGTPLAAGVRRFMEPRFGADFGHVRVHTGEAAAQQSASLNAHAFTIGGDIFFGRNQFQPESAGGRELIAHELTHTVQQGAVVQRAEAAISHRSEPAIQRLGIGDVLDWFADKARFIPGFRLLTIVLGVNPINMAAVERSGANILRGLLELIPVLGPLIVQALDSHGLLAKAGAWMEGRLRTLGLVGSALKGALTRFLNSLSLLDIARPASVWDRARRIFTEPIDRLVAFGKSLIGDLLGFIRQAILLPLARLAQGMRGYDFLKALLGEDPVTGEPVPRTAANLLGGFLKLIGQEEIWHNIQKANAIPRAFAWFQDASAQLRALAGDVPSRFRNALKALDANYLILPIKAFAKLAGVFNRVILDFMVWGAKAIWRLLEIIVEVVSPETLPYIKKIGAAFASILRNPIPFARNLISAAKLAFANFGANFLTHLKAGLLDWLLGSLPGIYIPKSWSIEEFAKFGFSLLGFSWEYIRSKMVRAIGEPAVQFLETSFKIVATLVRDGPEAMLDKIKDQFASLKDQAIDAVLNMALEMIVTRALVKLVSFFIPGANIVSAILSIYNVIRFFIDKISKIKEVAKAFLDSIIAIAGGAVTEAAARVEKSLAGMLSLVINFLFAFLGLGRVANKIRATLEKIRAPIDRILNKAVDTIVKLAKKAGKLAVQAGVPQDPNARLRLAAKAATASAKAFGSGITKPLMRPILRGIRIGYGLSGIDVYEQGGSWWVEASINPKIKHNMGIRSATKAGTAPAASKLQPMKSVTIEFKCNIYKYVLKTFEQQLKGQETGLNKISCVDWEANRAAFDKSGRGSNVPNKEIREAYAKDLALQGKSEKEIKLLLTKLDALHEPDLVAGGFNVVSRLGSRYINHSIGRQWKDNVELLKERVNMLSKADKPKRRINVKLKAVAYTPPTPR